MFWNICKIEYNAAVQMSKLELQIATRINLTHTGWEKNTVWYNLHIDSKHVKQSYINISTYWYMYALSIKTHKGKLNSEFRMIVTDGESKIEIKSMWNVQKVPFLSVILIPFWKIWTKYSKMVTFIQLSVGTGVLSIFLLCLHHFIKLFLNLVECFEKIQ